MCIHIKGLIFVIKIKRLYTLHHMFYERPLENNNSYAWAIQAQIHYKYYVNSNDVEISMD